MAMEVVVRVPPTADFFHLGGVGGGSGSPSSSLYLSAPTSPSCDAFKFFPLFDDDDHNATPLGSPSAVPFGWEEKPGIPKSPNDFEFHFNTISASLSADDLFHDGKIKPLKPPPAFQQSNMLSPRSPQNSKFSLRKSKSNIELNIINDDPFEAALIKETHSNGTNFELQNSHKNRVSRTDHKITYISSDFARKSSGSQSPFRISSDNEFDGDGEKSLAGAGAGAGKSKPATFLSSISFSKANRRKLRGLFFRSASEGRSASEKMDGDVRASSFWSADVGGSRFQFTAANRTVSENFMKKSFFLNKPGFLGRCLRSNRSGVPEISRGIGSLTRG